MHTHYSTVQSWCVSAAGNTEVECGLGEVFSLVVKNEVSKVVKELRCDVSGKTPYPAICVQDREWTVREY